MRRFLVFALVFAGLTTLAVAQDTAPAGNQAQRRTPEPTPPPADPRDFTGVWQLGAGGINLRLENDEAPPLTPEEAKNTQQLIDAEKRGAVVTDAPSQCFPHGVPRLDFAPYPIRFAYLPGEILMVHEVGHNLRIIHMDRKEAPKDTQPSFLGYSVGHWEGDVLVVETSHFNDKTLLDMHTFHGSKLKVTEHFQKQKTPQGTTNLVVHITVDDPEHFTKVFTVVRRWPFRSDLAATVGADGLQEYSCEENNRNVDLSSDGRVIVK